MKKNYENDIYKPFSDAMAKTARIKGLNTPWKEVLHLATQMVFSKNAVIPHQPQSGMYYLEKGTVIITYSSTGGQDRIALYIEPESLFNEARSLSGYEPGGEFRCLKDTILYRFPPNIISIDFISTYPHLVQNLLQSMGGKMLIHYSFLADMGTGSHLTHVARYIISLSQRNGDKKFFPSGVTQQEVADLLGVHRTTLARVIQQLKKMGVIEAFTAREVHISDYSLLRRLAEI
ncbi:MAG: Crp/Fnr family transcriptional regulator [Desulfovibrionaceae bacterium]